MGCASGLEWSRARTACLAMLAREFRRLPEIDVEDIGEAALLEALRTWEERGPFNALVQTIARNHARKVSQAAADREVARQELIDSASAAASNAGEEADDESPSDRPKFDRERRRELAGGFQRLANLVISDN